MGFKSKLHNWCVMAPVTGNQFFLYNTCLKKKKNTVVLQTAYVEGTEAIDLLCNQLITFIYFGLKMYILTSYQLGTILPSRTDLMGFLILTSSSNGAPFRFLVFLPHLASL